MNWLLQVVDPSTIGAFFAQVQTDMQTPAFWLAVGKIIWINVLLSGDNALVIAMACRGLHGSHRLWGMIIAGAALIMLVLDRFPILIWLGAILLGWIAGDVIESDPAVQPLLHRLVDGTIALDPDAASLIFRIWPHFNLEGELVGYLASLLGAITVLVVGSIWRRRKRQEAEHLALTDAVELARPVDRP